MQRVRISVREQDVVMVEGEGNDSATVVPVTKIEGCAAAGSSLPGFPRAGSRARRQ